MNAKKVLIGMFGSLFIGFFLLSPGGAMALARIATNTPTFIPPSVTPTDINFVCPVGTPAGWGTYTPSALWMLECSSCASVSTATSTSVPTFTPNPTFVNQTQAACQTVAPGGEVCLTAMAPTYTPSATGTPAVTSTPVSSGITFDPSVCSYANVGTSSCVFSNSDRTVTVTMAGQNNPYDQNFTVRLKDTLNRGVTHNVTVYVSISITGGGSNTRTWVNTYSTNSSGYWNNNTINSFPRSFYGTTGLPIQFIYGQVPNVWDTMGGTFVISIDSLLSTPTPTPSPTGTAYFDTGYCSSVAPTVDGFGFDLFVPDGAPNCNMGWDEFGVGEEYTVPAVQICFQPSQFGVIRMFNEDYEVGVYGLAAAAAFLWRYFRTV